MNYKHVRWLFIAPITLFVGLFEWLRHGPLEKYFIKIFPGWQETFFAVLILLGVIAIFSQVLFNYIQRLDNQLAFEREKLRLIFEHSVDAILLIGSDHGIQTINPAASRLLGWDQREVETRRCNDILKCHDRNQNPICRAACIVDLIKGTSQSSANVDMSIQVREGEFIPVSISYSDIPSVADRKNAIVMVIRDIRERKRLEKEMEAMTKIRVEDQGQQSTSELIYALLGKIAEVAKVDFVLYTSVEDGRVGEEVCFGLKNELEPLSRQEIRLAVQEVLQNKKMKLPSEVDIAKPGSVVSVQALAAYPVLFLDDSLIGVITCGRIKGSFAVTEMNIMTSIVEKGALVIENYFLYQKLKDRAVIDERYRLAREIHDGLAQGLSYLNLRCKVMADRLRIGRLEEAAREIEILIQVISDLCHEARNSIFDLKSISETGKDFADYLQNYLTQFEHQTSVKTRLVLPEEAVRLTSKTELHLIRLMQESLANIRKHAHASLAEVVVAKNPEGLQIMITDNGVGFSPSAESWRHFGLEIMQERSALIGATVSVARGTNGGTVVTIDLPNGKGGGYVAENQSSGS